MANDLTAKDVLYALEYLSDALVRSPAKTNRTNWHMRKSGLGVKEKVANEVRGNPVVTSINDAGNQIIKWHS